MRRKSSDLFGELFLERNFFTEYCSNYSFYEELSLDLKLSSNLVRWIEQRGSPSRERNSFIERVLFFYEPFFYEIASLNVFSSFMIYISSPQPSNANKVVGASNAYPEIPLPKNLSRKIARFFVSKIGPATGVTYASGRINFLRRKSSDLFGELFSERNSFIEDGSNYSFYEEISLDLK